MISFSPFLLFKYPPTEMSELLSDRLRERRNAFDLLPEPDQPKALLLEKISSHLKEPEVTEAFTSFCREIADRNEGITLQDLVKFLNNKLGWSLLNLRDAMLTIISSTHPSSLCEKPNILNSLYVLVVAAMNKMEIENLFGDPLENQPSPEEPN